MKTIYTLLGLILFSTFSVFAQEKEECNVNLSLGHDMVKAKKYDAAMPYWEKVYKSCPKLSEAVFDDGIQIYYAKLKKAQAAKDDAKVKENLSMLTKLYDQWIANFPNSKYIGKTYQGKGLLMLKYKTGTKEDLYKVFNDGFTKGKSKFTNPKALYAYFDAAVAMFKNNKLSFEDVINHYDKISEALDSYVVKYTKKMEVLQKKEESEELSKKEARRLKQAKQYIPAYSIVLGEMDKILGELGDCEHLVPLYTRNFDDNKENVAWLKKAAANLSKKECTKDPIFKKLVEQMNVINPSYSSSYYLGIMNEKDRNYAQAVSYYKKAINLTTEAYDKAKVYYKLAKLSKNRGQKAQARTYARKALEFKPSMGGAYILIAQLYASSANQCGTDEFSKRATYWLAASMADRAASVDPSKTKYARKMAANYRAKAPSKQQIFMKSMAGKTVKMGCWIGGSVKVPNIK